MSGVLYGIGLGPGDPELMTLKAARLISEAAVVAYPCLPGAESFARKIAAGMIREGTIELAFEVPMTPERAPAQMVYDKAAKEIAGALEAGGDVVVLCEGDPFFYGSFMYLHARLSERFTVEVVPGVTSVSAASARMGLPLVARNEMFSVLPAPLEDAALRAGLDAADSVAIIKVGRHLGRVRAVIEGLGLTKRAIYIERATLGEERVLPLCDAPDPAPYFSMILLTKGADPWL